MRKILYNCPMCQQQMIVVDHLEIEDSLPETVTCASDSDIACLRGDAYLVPRPPPQNIVASHETFLEEGKVKIRQKGTA